MPLTLDQLQTLDRLMQQALDLPLDQRGQWIDTLPPLHAGLVPLLRAHLLEEANREGVETADFPGALPVLPGLNDRTGDPVAGERVGPYRLIRPLGEGGMSSVWLAERVDGTIRREVALKLPHRHLLDRGLAARMQRERDILAALNHDHIARLYDAGVDNQSRPYLAIEYVVGAPINLHCGEKNLGLDTRVRLMVQVTRAVAHAHANLIVHRDLKPNNILVGEGEGDSTPRVKLLDFGIAKLLASDDVHNGSTSQAADLTQTLGRALTPDYASPEQLREQPVTTASDIYSLGVVLYEVVTGEKPYKLKRQSVAALAEAVVNADVVRPGKRAAEGRWAQDAKKIDGDLDAIIMKALKAAPEDRYATASALADDLERFLARLPVMAQPDSLAYRTRRFLQRHALATAAGAAVSIALVAGATVALWQAREARLETAKTRAVKDFLLSIITVGNVDQQDALMRRKQPIGDVLLDAAKLMPGRFTDQPEVRAELQGLLGTALGDLSMKESARTLQEARFAEVNARGAPLLEKMQAQVDLAVTLFDGPEENRGMTLLEEVIAKLDGTRDVPSRLLLARSLRATAIAKVERFDGKADGVRDAERALVIAEQLEPGSKAHVSTLSLLGLARGHYRDHVNAEIAFERAITLAHKLPPAEQGYEASVRLRYAEALIPRRYHLRALAQLNEALASIERSAGAESFRWARTAVIAANLTAAVGDVPKALALFERVLQVYAKFDKEIDPLYASTAESIYGANLAEYGRFTDALRMGQAAYAPYREEGARKRAPFGAVWSAATRYAHVLQMTGDYAQADKLLSAALDGGRERNFSRANSDFIRGERLLAQNHLYRGRLLDAEHLFREIIAVDGAPENRFVSQRNFSRPALARALLEQGKLNDAEKEIATMAAIIDKVAEDEIAISRPSAAQLESVIGGLKLKRGDTAGAVPHFRRAIDIMLPRSDAQSPIIANARAELALALAMKGERAEAQSLVQQARVAFAQHTAVAPHLRRRLAEAERELAKAKAGS